MNINDVLAIMYFQMDDGYIEERNGLTDLQMLEEQQRQDVEFTANVLAQVVHSCDVLNCIEYNIVKMSCV